MVSPPQSHYRWSLSLPTIAASLYDWHSFAVDITAGMNNAAGARETQFRLNKGTTEDDHDETNGVVDGPSGNCLNDS